jgi:DinB superfamily
MENPSTSPLAMSVQVALSSWDMQNSRFLKLLDALTDEQLQSEIAPGRNTGVYLLGHLAAVHDYMLPLLGLGERLFPDLEEPFLRKPDKSGLDFPSVAELKSQYAAVNAALSTGFATLSPENWLEKHTSISDADFQKEPHRNKLNLLLNRTGHLAYHFGQVALLK